MDRIESTGRDMACAVCGYPLERQADRSTGETLSWIHLRWNMQDHPPVPIDPIEIRVNHRCDFCDAEPVTAIVLCTSFEMPVGREHTSTSVGNWTACTECGELVRRRRWSQLVARVRKVAGGIAALVPKSDIERMYALVEVHMLGIISVQEWMERLGVTVDE